VIVDRLGLAPGLSLVSLPSFLGRAPGFPATAALLVIFAARVFGLVAAAAFMVSGSTAGVGFDFRRVHLGTPSSALSAFGFFQLGSLALCLLPCALRPSFIATSLLFFLSTRLVLLLLSLAPCAASLVLSAARLFCSLLCGFFFSPAGTAFSTARLPLGISLFAPSTPFIVRGRVGTAAAGL
jgi:hypothetical protein